MDSMQILNRFVQIVHKSNYFIFKSIRNDFSVFGNKNVNLINCIIQVTCIIIAILA